MSSYYTTPIDENECIGDSLDTINANFSALDMVGAILSAGTAVISPLYVPALSGLVYTIGFNENAPLTAIKSTDAVFEYLEVGKNQNSTNFTVFNNFASGNDVQIINRYATLSSSYYITNNLQNISYTDLTKTIRGDFIINNVDSAGYIAFNTNNINRITIAPNGNVGIGSYWNPDFNLTNDPNHQLELDTDSAAKLSGGLWAISSDERLKENIELANTQTCYNIIKNLPLKRFTVKSEIFSTKQVSDRSRVGWIAQDVQSVFPKAVKTNTKTFKPTPESEPVKIEDCLSLDADQIYATLYGAVQQLITIVEQQSATIINLQNQLQNS